MPPRPDDPLLLLKPETLSAEVCAQLELIQAKPGADLSRFPDFLILGPQRTGTSWLNSHLKVHPEIFLPKEKETYFFSTLLEPEKQKFEYPRLEDYTGMAMTEGTRRLWRRKLEALVFQGTKYQPRFLGDATASYATLDPRAIREICLINPEMKAILTIREPKDRVWSHAKKKFTEHSGLTIDEIDPEELDKFLRAGGQINRGIYSTMIANWRAHLKPGHLFIAEFRLAKEDPNHLLTEMLTFIGAESQRFLERRNLEEKVYATGSSRIPSAVASRIDELYAAASADYEQVLADLAEHQHGPGVYQI